MSGVFASWQPRYAQHGIPTFPVRFEGDDKRPHTRGYLKTGINGSQQLALKFPDATAFGFAVGKRTKITVLDVDTPCEQVLEAAFARHGEPAIIAQSPRKGGWHCWYRHNGEPRDTTKTRWPDIDLLGSGFVVAPPSEGPHGRYEFVKGGLDDLPKLQPMRGLDKGCHAGRELVPQGRRDNCLFSRLLREVRACDDFETHLDVARSLNMDCMPPLSDAQVVSKAKQAWKYEIDGRNWVGRRARASTDRDEILTLSSQPNAAVLLSLLRVSHPDPDAVFAIDHAQTAKLLGWNRKRMPPSIDFLLKCRRLIRVHSGARGEPHLYRLGRA